MLMLLRVVLIAGVTVMPLSFFRSLYVALLLTPQLPPTSPIKSFCFLRSEPEAFFDSHSARSEWACAPFPSLIALQPGHPQWLQSHPQASCFFPTEFVLVQVAMAGLELDLDEHLACPQSPCRLSNLHGTPITLLMASLHHLRCGSSLVISRGLNTPSGFSYQALGTGCFSFRSKFRTCIWDSFCSWDLWRFALPTLPHQMGQISVTVSVHAVFRIAFSRRDLVDTWIGCCLCGPSITAGLASLL